MHPASPSSVIRWEMIVTSLYDFTVRKADGSALPLAEQRGKVLLIVNTASRCGFTPQYAGLEALYRRHQAEGFLILGFPSNQFGRQEPGNAEEIASFCSLNYDVSFPVLAKVDVNGPAAEPLFDHLKHARPGMLGSTRIKWNFTKFLVGRDGDVLARFAPATKPGHIEASIVEALAR